VFLREASKLFEIVIYTAGQARYASPLIDLIDEQKVRPAFLSVVVATWTSFRRLSQRYASLLFRSFDGVTFGTTARSAPGGRALSDQKGCFLSIESGFEFG
jgi:hypothetical protein